MNNSSAKERPITTSYPYLALANKTGENYSHILKLADAYKNGRDVAPFKELFNDFNTIIESVVTEVVNFKLLQDGFIDYHTGEWKHTSGDYYAIW